MLNNQSVKILFLVLSERINKPISITTLFLNIFAYISSLPIRLAVVFSLSDALAPASQGFSRWIHRPGKHLLSPMKLETALPVPSQGTEAGITVVRQGWVRAKETPGKGQGLLELGFQTSEWSCLGFQQGFTRPCGCWWKPSPSPGGPAGPFADGLHPWSRDGGKKQVWGPLFQEIPFQSPGVQCPRVLVYVSSLHTSLQLLVPAKGRSLCRGVAKVYSPHLAPSQQELLGPAASIISCSGTRGHQLR